MGELTLSQDGYLACAILYFTVAPDAGCLIATKASSAAAGT